MTLDDDEVVHIHQYVDDLMIEPMNEQGGIRLVVDEANPFQKRVESMIPFSQHLF